MKNQTFNTNQLYGFFLSDIEGINSLAELALDMRWSWNHAADELWSDLDAELWELTHNPWIVLQTVSKDQLEQKLATPTFLKKISELKQLKEQDAVRPAWFQHNHPISPITCIAYFSMEFMLSEALPIYVGGLGNVAGDQLKSASDLGLPVVAVGLLYQQGYFRQEIDTDGSQKAYFPYNDPGQLPIMPLRLPNGEWLRLKINLAGQTVWIRTWQVQVGKVKLYLLDSNDAANFPVHRGITSELYGGGSDLRIQQEIILGIGGWKLLSALGITPEVCHMNEGHSAFLVLERANDYRKKNNVSFEVALAITRAGNLFTTHTAVAAGFDYFDPELMRRFFGAYAKDELGIDFSDLMALGRVYPNNFSESFNMANLAIRGSGAINGVSQLHGEVSRHLFEYLFPRWPVEEVPVGAVTNGVHMPSWDSEAADIIWSKTCGEDRWKGEQETLEKDISKLSDEVIWNLRTTSREKLVAYTRHRFERQLTISGQQAEIIETAKKVFDPGILTLGFARRFVSYKRPNLLLYDEERLIRLLTNYEHPVQLIIAGKAPPYDESGKSLIKQWVQFIQRHNLYHRVVFLSDYDMLLTEHLVQGVDVWLNTPRRPWEACGTSGMKVLVNGGINLSELDGWWAEAYTPEVGWAIGDAKEHGDDPARDAAEADALYTLLEQEIVPEFYQRDQNGFPVRWVEKIRKSMATLTPRFSANRAVREYTKNYYLPAAVNYRKRMAENGNAGDQLVNTRLDLEHKWAGLKFDEMQTERLDDSCFFKIKVYLNGIKPEDVSVSLYAESVDGQASEKIRMDVTLPVDEQGKYEYAIRIFPRRPLSDYTARIIPDCENISVPLENNLIYWQH